MILRRLMQHVRDQNWFAVGLDLAIVVIGVVIAFQVTAWNDALASDARGRGYLARMQVDLNVDIEIYDDRMAFWNIVSGHGVRALEAAEAGSGDAVTRDDWSLILDFMHASQVAEIQSSQTAYLEIISTGELGLIRDADLRRAVSEYYALQAYPVFTEWPDYRVTVRELIPVDVQLFIWRNCYREHSNASWRMVVCDSPLTTDEARVITDRLLLEPGIERELRFWISALAASTTIATNRRDHAIELRDAIEAELDASR